MKQFTFIQLIVLGLVAFLSFKWGQSAEKIKQIERPKEKDPNKLSIESNGLDDDETLITKELNKLRKKPNKTQKEKNQIGLLEVALREIQKKK